jgi:hypothetical protein
MLRPMTAQDYRPIRRSALRGPLDGSAAVLTAAVCLYLIGAGSTVAAPANELRNPNVNPTSGTIKTRFEFIVRYESGRDNEPTSVTAVAGNVVIPLRLVSGRPADGRYRGTAKLPAGRWPITFQATARGNDPTLDGPTVKVTKTLATPRPTPRPTPAPTIAPPPAAPQTTAPTTPAPAKPSATRRPRRETPSPTPRETGLTGGGLATRTPKATAAPASGGTDGERQVVTILTGGLIAIGALALIGVFALLRDRRRRSRDSRLELLPEGAATRVPAAARAISTPRAPTAWERDFALDHEPIGSVEYRLPTEPEDEDG